MSEKEIVALQFDTQALKHSLRFAFASDMTPVQELIQNARRAGASKVDVSTGVTEEGEPFVAIMDDGCGLENFQVLLTVASSGWSGDVIAQEGPYGLGFLSAIYAAKHVEVISRGKILRMTQADVLANGQFEVEEFDDEIPEGFVTVVKLFGVDAEKIKTRVPQIVRGYPIEVALNGISQPRPDALDSTYRSTAVGHIKRHGDDLASQGVAIYLQGFRVRSTETSRCDDLDVVHLDQTRYFGKFPDRDVVINDGDMLEQVKAELRGLYVEALLDAKQRLPALKFMEQYKDMARSLQMLHVFNDIDILPKSFLNQVTGLPYEYPWYEGNDYLQPGAVGEAFSRDDLSSDALILSELDPYVCEDDSENCLRWVAAFAAKAWMLDVELDEEHWIHDLIRLNDSATVHLQPLGDVKQGKAESRRLNCIGAVDLVLCSDVEVEIRFAGSEVALKFTIGEPVADEREGRIYVPDSDGDPMYVGQSVLLQLSSYHWEDEFHQNEVDEDEATINQMVVELAAKSPEQQLELALRSAIESYSQIRSLVCTISVDASGTVKVQQLARAQTN